MILRSLVLSDYLLCTLQSSINIYFEIIAYILDIKSEQIEIKLEYCGCKRQIRKKELVSNSLRNLWINQTTCGIDAFTRGMNQKVIGMSLFGDHTMRRL